jgi:hypothetical protein
MISRRLTSHRHHARCWTHGLSRRRFVQSTLLAGGLLLARPRFAGAEEEVTGETPRPIPGGFQPFGPGTEVFHNFAPGVFDPIDTDRSGIFDFNGNLGYATIDGAGTARTAAGETRLLFEVDLRFMQGAYIGEDGRERHATFALL